MKSLYLSLIAFFVLSTVSANAFAEETLNCTELPPIAWDSTPRTSVRVVIDISLPRVTSAKELYLNALCGAQPASIWDLVLSGRGGIVEIPRPLAEALDSAVPYMPRVDFMYVRGGGENREVAVILFANGYDGPFFELDRSGDDNPWTRTMVERAARMWNKLPYDVMRKASHWLHDAALYDEEYTVHLRALSGLIDITVFTQPGSRGLATWLGTLFTPRSNTVRDLPFWVHEIGHYVDYEMNGVRDFAYASEGSFAGISKENNRILGVPVPFWFRLRHDEARQWRDDRKACETYHVDEAPWGFATIYGMCGEMSGEDFADSFVIAAGVTQAIRETEYLGQPWSYYKSGYFDTARLYGRSAGADAGVIAQKVDYIHEHLAIHKVLPQDADRDGVTWVHGLDASDCSDINPVDGLCESIGCSSDVECDDGEACTVDLCREGQCIYNIIDSDNDGSPDAACGGPDCDDSDPNIAVGSIRQCQGACNLDGEQQCLEGRWTECSAPTTCECDPNEPPQVVPCANCGFQERSCNPDGTWAPLTACQPIDPGADQCTPGTTRVLESGCGDQTCAGRSIGMDREETCDSQCNWEETRACTLKEPTTAEICNGIDDDCDQDIDEGCIEKLTFSRRADQPLIMGTYPYGSGFPNETNCPAEHALVGFKLTDATFRAGFSSYRVLGAIKPMCRAVNLGETTTAGATEYAVESGSNLVQLATHGKWDDFHDVWTCPSGEFVRGVQVKRGWFIDRIKVHCGQLAVNGSVGSYALDRRNGANSPIMVAGTDLNETQHCNGDSIATGLRTQTGDVVDAIGLNCSTVSLTLK